MKEFFIKHKYNIGLAAATILFAVLLGVFFKTLAGVFGYVVITFPIFCACVLFFRIKKPKFKLPPKSRITAFLLTVFFLIVVLHITFVGKDVVNGGFSSYVTGSYDDLSVGGVIMSFITCPVVLLCKYTASLIIFYICLAVCSFLLIAPTVFPQFIKAKKPSVIKEGETEADRKAFLDRLKSKPNTAAPVAAPIEAPVAAEKKPNIARDILITPSEGIIRRDIETTSYEIKSTPVLTPSGIFPSDSDSSARRKLFGESEVAGFDYDTRSAGAINGEEARRKLLLTPEKIVAAQDADSSPQTSNYTPYEPYGTKDISAEDKAHYGESSKIYNRPISPIPQKRPSNVYIEPPKIEVPSISERKGTFDAAKIDRPQIDNSQTIGTLITEDARVAQYYPTNVIFDDTPKAAAVILPDQSAVPTVLPTAPITLGAIPEKPIVGTITGDSVVGTFSNQSVAVTAADFSVAPDFSVEAAMDTAKPAWQTRIDDFPEALPVPEEEPVVKAEICNVPPAENDEEAVLNNGISKRILKGPYKPPLVTFLGDHTYNDVVENFEELRDVLENQMAVKGIKLKLVDVVKGPTLTLCKVKLAPDCPIAKLWSLRKDITIALKSPKPIMIVDQIGTTGLTGIEIPHAKPGTVGFKSIVTSDAFISCRGEIAIALGRLSDGALLIEDIASMPHALIAGSTGSGKSVCVNVILASILYRYSPDDIRLVLIDLKGVELAPYDGLPHNLLDNSLNEPKEIMSVLDWCRDETQRRYDLFKTLHLRNLDGYNSSVEAAKRLPRILIIIDEASELMEDPVYGKSIEKTLGSIARIARAAGVHLLFATQNPVKSVITNEIQNNLNTKIAFQVGEHTHSQVIFKANGAETLMGRGDMLIKKSLEMRRAQCAFVTTEEVEKMTDYVRKNNNYSFDREFIHAVLTYDKNKRNQKAPVEEEAAGYNTKIPERTTVLSAPSTGAASDTDTGDKVKRAESIETEALAMRCCIIEQKCSISWLQRRLSASFNTVASIVERLERMGYLGKVVSGQKNRAIILTAEEFNKIYPDYAITPEELSENE